MRTVFIHLSSLLGLLVFLNQLSSSAEIERTVFIAIASGLAIYLVLMVTYATVHRILLHASSRSNGEEGGAQTTPVSKTPAASANQPDVPKHAEASPA